MASKHQHDFFISYAREDSRILKRVLSNAFLHYGILSIWLDEISLPESASIRESIDRGLKSSRYVLVILSKNYFRKEWALRELAGAMSIRKKIVPLWHNVKSRDVARFSPMLADLKGIKVSEGYLAVGEKLSQILLKNRHTAFSRGAKERDEAAAFWSGVQMCVSYYLGYTSHEEIQRINDLIAKNPTNQTDFVGHFGPHLPPPELVRAIRKGWHFLDDDEAEIAITMLAHEQAAKYNWCPPIPGAEEVRKKISAHSKKSKNT